MKCWVVTKGRKTGVIKTLSDLQKSIKNFPKYEVKRFPSEEKARAFWTEYQAEQKAAKEEIKAEQAIQKEAAEITAQSDGQTAESEPEAAEPKKKKSKASPSYGTEGAMIAFVDGSYDERTKQYGYACVCVTSTGTSCLSGAGSESDLTPYRNVTGELIAAMQAVNLARIHGCASIEIAYDYTGIEDFITGKRPPASAFTKRYRKFMRKSAKKLNIRFCKLPAHSGNAMHNIADKLAKQAAGSKFTG